MKVLIACEESQTVCKAFRDKGHNAYSCDVVDCSGGYPQWHIKDDVFNVINDSWDMMIAHPPCTYLTVTGNRWFNKEVYGEKAIKRIEEREKAIEFFMKLYQSNIPKIAIENPIGYINPLLKYSQIIHPYYFGDSERKATCLWLKGLSPLMYGDNLFNPSNIVKPKIIVHKSGRTDSEWHFKTISLPKEERSRLRSKTFPGIAKAMADQWG
jgi:hypothetical protein